MEKPKSVFNSNNLKDCQVEYEVCGQQSPQVIEMKQLDAKDDCIEDRNPTSKTIKQSTQKRIRSQFAHIHFSNNVTQFTFLKDSESNLPVINKSTLPMKSEDDAQNLSDAQSKFIYTKSDIGSMKHHNKYDRQNETNQQDQNKNDKMKLQHLETIVTQQLKSGTGVQSQEQSTQNNSPTFDCSTFKITTNLGDESNEKSLQEKQIDQLQNQFEAKVNADFDKLLTHYNVKWLELKGSIRLIQGYSSYKQWFESQIDRGKKIYNNEQIQSIKILLRMCNEKKIDKKVDLKGWREHKDAFQQFQNCQQCNFCFKYSLRLRVTRHKKCFIEFKQDSYKHFTIDQKFVCMLCFTKHTSTKSFAQHLLNDHHPLDLKFFGINAVILGRINDQCKVQSLRIPALTSDCSMKIRHQTSIQEQQITNIDDHLSTVVPFFSILNKATESSRTQFLADGLPYFLRFEGKRLSHCYQVERMQDYIFAGCSLDTIISLMKRLGRDTLLQDYGYNEIYSAGGTINLVLKYNKSLVRLYQPLKAVLHQSPEKGYMMCQLVMKEIKLLNQTGVNVLQGININHWLVKFDNSRVIFCAPHWLSTSKMKTDEVGSFEVQSNSYSQTIKIKGGAGQHLQAIFLYLIHLVTEVKGESLQSFITINDQLKTKPVVFTILQSSLSKYFDKARIDEVIKLIQQLVFHQPEEVKPYSRLLTKIKALDPDEIVEED